MRPGGTCSGTGMGGLALEGGPEEEPWHRALHLAGMASVPFPFVRTLMTRLVPGGGVPLWRRQTGAGLQSRTTVTSPAAGSVWRPPCREVSLGALHRMCALGLEVSRSLAWGQMSWDLRESDVSKEFAKDLLPNSAPGQKNK